MKSSGHFDEPEEGALLLVLFLVQVPELVGQGVAYERTYSPLAKAMVDSELLQRFAYAVFFFRIQCYVPMPAGIDKCTI